MWTSDALGLWSKAFLAAKTTVCGAALIGINIITSWVEKELRTLDISYLEGIPRPFAESDSFQKAREAYAKMVQFGCFAVVPKKVLKTSRKILRETYRDSIGKFSYLTRKCLTSLRNSYGKMVGFKGLKRYLYKYFIKSPVVALSLMCASLTFPMMLGYKFISRPKHIAYGIIRAATFSAFYFVHPIHASHAVLYSYAQRAKRLDRLACEDNNTEECTERDEINSHAETCESTLRPTPKNHQILSKPPERTSIIKIQVVGAKNLIPSITNDRFSWGFRKQEKRFVEVYIERVRDDGSVLCDMLGKTTTKVGTLNPSWETSEESFDFLYSQEEKCNFPNQKLKIFFEIKSENQPQGKPLRTSAIDPPKIMEEENCKKALENNNMIFGSFTEVGDEARFQRRQCIIFTPDHEVDSGGRLVVDVLHQYMEIVDMEESEDGILIHSQKIF